jgi:arginine deiminase
VWSTQDVDDFVIPPVPNTLFQRDNTVWIGHGATVNPMALPPRRRESLNTRTVYRHHPLFAAAREAGRFVVRYVDDLDHVPATMEGGDIHVLDHETAPRGSGGRTASTR